MSASRIKMGPIQWSQGAKNKEKFIPKGKIVEVGDPSEWYTRSHRANPIKRRIKEGAQGGRIIVGFNVGIEEKWKIEDIVDLVFGIRHRQVTNAIKDGQAQPHPAGGDIGLTFLTQMGIWQDISGDTPYPERGAQVVIMNIIQEDRDRFADDMIEIAEIMVKKLQQNAVIVEMSDKGVVTETIEVGP